MSLDVEYARSCFPAVATDWALMDNAGGSVPLGAVIERVRDYMSNRMVQLGADYPLSVEAREAVAAGKLAAAALVNASPEEIVIGANTTSNIRVLASALRPLWRPGDEIVVTNLDHESNIGPWRQLEASGIRIREWRFDSDSLRLRARDLEALLSERTRLVAFTHCSNLIGTVHDARRISRLAHDAGALSCVDGVAFAPHRRVDVRALEADFYLVSLYKTFGPHIGLMFGRREHLERAHSQNHFFVGPEAGPYRFEPGNPNHELVDRDSRLSGRTFAGERWRRLAGLRVRADRRAREPHQPAATRFSGPSSKRPPAGRLERRLRTSADDLVHCRCPRFRKSDAPHREAPHRDPARSLLRLPGSAGPRAARARWSRARQPRALQHARRGDATHRGSRRGDRLVIVGSAAVAAAATRWTALRTWL